MQAPRPSPIHLAAAAVITVTALLPYWITISMGRGATLDAGLWGTSRARWDDMRVDLDMEEGAKDREHADDHDDVMNERPERGDPELDVPEPVGDPEHDGR